MTRGIEGSSLEVVGKDFRVPIIVGYGSGRGFGIENLHVIKGWHQVSQVLKEMDLSRF